MARPRSSTRTPVARGSSVPRWPIWRKPTMRRTASTTSCEVFPRGLSITSAPSNAAGCVLARHASGILRGFGDAGLGNLAEQFLDAPRFLDGGIEEEAQFRAAAHLQAFAQFVANVAARGFEPCESVGLFFGSAFDDRRRRVPASSPGDTRTSVTVMPMSRRGSRSSPASMMSTSW